jgi:hypothetical protein
MRALLLVSILCSLSASAQPCEDTAGELITSTRRARSLTAAFDEVRTTFATDQRLAASYEDSTKPEDLRFNAADGGVDFHPYGALLTTRAGTSGYSGCVGGAAQPASIEVAGTSYLFGFEHAPTELSVDARFTQHWIDVKAHPSSDGLALPSPSLFYARAHQNNLALATRWRNLAEATFGVGWFQPLRFDPGAEPPLETQGALTPRWLIALGSPRLRLSQGLVFGNKTKPVELAYLDVREYPVNALFDASAGAFYVADEAKTYARIGAGLRPHQTLRFSADVAPEFNSPRLRYARAGGGFDLVGETAIGRGRFAVVGSGSFFNGQYVHDLKGRSFWGFDYLMLLEGRLRSMTVLFEGKVALSSPEVLTLYPESAGAISYRVMFYVRFGPGGI